MADIYFDDQKRFIGTTVADVLIYLQSLTGVSLAENVVYTMNCPMVALIRVNASGVIPKFLYKNGLTSANKIFLKQIPGATLNLTPLCNGVTYANIVQPPELGTPVSETVDYYTTEDLSEYYTNEIDILLENE